MAWVPLPEPLTWTLPTPLTFNGMQYGSVTLRAPSGADIMKASAIPGASGLDVTLRLIEAVSAEHVPYEALKTLPAYMVMQMGNYMDEFSGAPEPDPLAAWRAARMAATKPAATTPEDTGTAEPTAAS